MTDDEGLPIPIEFFYLLVDDDRRILYCEVPKVSCTSWKQTLIYLTGKTNATSPEELTPLYVHDTLGDTALRRLHR
jgi:Sulfotransferase family